MSLPIFALAVFATAGAQTPLWSRVDDLQRRFPRHKAPSLQRIVAEVLGEYVDKSLQRSDWDSRPLSPEQLRYAALDADVLLRLEAAFAT